MVVPVTYEFRSGRGDTALQQLRNSVAYEELDKRSNVMNSVTALQARERLMSVTSFPTITTGVASILLKDASTPADGDGGNFVVPMDVDLVTGKVLARLAYTSFGTIDPATNGYTELANIVTDLPMKTYYDLDTTHVNIQTAQVLPNGNWLLSLGRNEAATFGGIDAGRLFLSTDKGLTWTLVCSMVNGHHRYFGAYGNVSGNRVVVGEYNSTIFAGNPRAVWLSEDYGVTWTKILDPDADGFTHIHCLCFDPTNENRIFMSLGDAGYRQLVPITKTDGVWSAGTKTAGFYSTGIAGIQPTCMMAYQGKIWLGHDESGSNGAIQIYDPAAGTWVRGWYPFDPAGASLYYDPALMGDPYIMGIKVQNGVFYAACINTTDLRYGGLLVSADGYRWTFLRRTTGATNGGAYGVAGVVGGKFYWNSFLASANKTSYCIAPGVKGVKGVIAERAETPLLSAEQSENFTSVTDTLGGWVKAGDVSTLALDATAGIGGGPCLKATMGAHSSGYGEIRFHPATHITWGANEYLTVVAYVKPGALWDYFSQVKLELWGTGITRPATTNYQQIGSGWTRLVTIAKAPVGGCADALISVFIDKQSVGDTLVPTGAVLYIDRIQAYASATQYLQSDSWQIGGTDRLAEVPSYPIVGGGANWSIAFSWFPLNGYQSILADIPVCTVLGSDAVNLVLSWIQATTVLSGTDGTQTVAATTTTLFEKDDQINIALTSDGTDTILYVEDPINGAVAAKTLTAVNLTGVPTSLLLGSNADKSSIGIGAFTNVRIFNSKLSAADVAEVFRVTSRGWKIDTTSKSIYSRLIDA